MTVDPHLHPWRHRLRAMLSWLHLWIGLAMGVLFALLGLSGSVLTFHSELLLAQHPQIAAQQPVANGAVLSHLMETWASRGMTAIDVPRPSMPAWQGYFADDSRRYFATDTGELLLTRTTGNDWLLWLHELHTHFLAGETGEEVVGITGWIACFLLLSGLYLWWPRFGRWLSHLRPHANPPVRRWLTWHRSAGAITLPLLFLVSLCGVGMVYHDGARALLTGLLGGSAAPRPPRTASMARPLDWSRVLASARAGMPDAQLSRIAVPRDGNQAISIRARMPAEWHPNGRSLVFVAGTGDTLPGRYDATAQPAGTRATDAIYPLHIGAVGGLPYRLAVAFAGLLPSFLLVTGFLFWRRRLAMRRVASR
ncbi:MAG TPA: PepSY-associated TM helix domain-containing protein [Lysobacter sp.]|nr:PepSY-associated TM helix domain-containing protein [Lysobacter sp.]